MKIIGMIMTLAVAITSYICISGQVHQLGWRAASGRACERPCFNSPSTAKGRRRRRKRSRKVYQNIIFMSYNLTYVQKEDNKIPLCLFISNKPQISTDAL
jgi:hypothetical protein